jgi:hypothetical protein
MSSTSNTENTNEEILNDIQSLQTIEQDLISSLDANHSLTSQQQEQIINKINSISQMRINLYETLGEISGLYQNSLINSQGTLSQQSRVIDIVENTLLNSPFQV